MDRALTSIFKKLSRVEQGNTQQRIKQTFLGHIKCQKNLRIGNITDGRHVMAIFQILYGQYHVCDIYRGSSAYAVFGDFGK